MRSKTFLRSVVALLIVLAVPLSAVAQTPITWQSQTNVTEASTTITKTSGTNNVPNAGALSGEQLAAGVGGTFSFTATATSNKELWVGLSNDAATNSSAGMSHAFFFGSGGTNASIRENGVYRGETPFVAGDVFSIEVTSAGVVTFKKNGSTVTCSPACGTATLPLKLDLQIADLTGSITAATYAAAGGGGGSGGTVKVCSAGCDYTNAQLQTAVNAAAAATGGSLILLEEGVEYNVALTLPVKSDAGPTSKIEIRTGVNSTGTIQATSRYTPDGARVCPSGLTIDDMTCTGQPGLQDMSRFAKIKPFGNNSYGVQTADTGSGTPVSYYKLRWIEFVPNDYRGNSLIGIKNDTAPVTTGTVAMLPHHIEIDQVVVRGDPIRGQFRGIQVDGSNVTITNSTAYDIKSPSEGQVVWSNTNAGGFTVTNNYFNGGAETILTGGAGTRIRAQYVVQSGASTTSVPLDRVTDLYVGKSLAFRINPTSISSISATSPAVITTSAAHGLSSNQQIVISGSACSAANASTSTHEAKVVTVLTSTTFSLRGGYGAAVDCTAGGGAGGTYYIRASSEITNITGNTITVSPALPVTPIATVIAEASIVIGQSAPNVITRNWFTRPASWRTVMIQAPATSPSATGSTTGGTLAAGNYYYIIQAQLLTTAGEYANSAPTSQVMGNVASGTTGSVTVNWTAAANADRYVVFGGAVGSTAITESWTVNAPTVSFTDTGSAGTAATAVRTTSPWQVKNTFELKQGINWTIEYNLIEHSWVPSQVGPCIVLTGTQQMNAAPSAVLRNITFRKNIVRRCAQAIQIVGMDVDYSQESARSGGFTFEDNLFYDFGGVYGTSNGMLIADGGGPRHWPDRGPYSVTFNRNTFHSTGNSWSRWAYLDMCDPYASSSLESPVVGFTLTNNIMYSGVDGATIASTGPGTVGCSIGTSVRRVGVYPSGPIGTGSSITNNVFAGDSNCGGYPANVQNLACPSVATLESDTFTNTTTFTGFAVKTTSPHYTTSTTGGPLGAAISTFVNDITNYTMTGAAFGSGPLTIDTSTPLPTGIVGQSYSVTLSASGGTGPYTWALTVGTLPNGLLLNSSTGAITGTPTTAVTGRALTFRVTDALSTQVSKAFTMDVIRLTARGLRYNWSEAATFRRATPPANPADQVWVGDTWYDLTSNALKVATSLGPPILWSTVGGADLSNLNATNLTTGTVPVARLGASGTRDSTTFLRGDNTWQTATATGAPATQTLALWAGSAITMTPLASPTTAANEFAGQRNARMKADVENSTQCALNVSLVNESTTSGNLLKLQYWDGSAWQDAGCSVGITTAAPVIMEGSFATLAVGARTQDRIFRAFVSTGDGTDTISVGTVYVRLR